MAKRHNAKGRGANKTGRSETPDRFIRWWYWLAQSKAFRELTGGAVKTLVAMTMAYNGSNNGKIAFGARSGILIRNPDKTDKLNRYISAPFGTAPSAQAENISELEAAGFIVCTRESVWECEKGAKGQGIVREWRLTWERCDGKPPTKDFMTRSGPFRRKRPAKEKSDYASGKPDSTLSHSAVDRTAATSPPPQSTPHSAVKRTKGARHSAVDRTHILTISRKESSQDIDGPARPEAAL